MAFNTAAPLNQLITILTAISGIRQVYKGAPENFAKNVVAYVAAGQQDIRRHTTGTTRRRASYFVGLAYRVSDAEADAEGILCDSLDAFIAAVMADLTLNGTCKETVLDFTLASAPEYEVRAGREFRVYPLLVHCTQDGTYALP